MACRGFVKQGICAISVISSLLAGLFWRSFLELQSESDQPGRSVEKLEATLRRETKATRALLNELAAARAAIYHGVKQEARPQACPACPAEAGKAGLIPSPPGPGHYTRIGLAAVADRKHQSKFGIAIASQRCYAEHHGYDFEVIDPKDYATCNKFKDFFFRKHCSVARFLEKQQEDYILFVFDGDNPVVWLERSLDHWLKEVAATDVVLYERWMNNEIMAGNYAVRNSKFGIDFLDGWAAFEEELPKQGYHSSDNGAIHLHILRALGLRNEKPCTQHWSHLGSDRNYMDEYYAFVSCTRLVMGAPRRWKFGDTHRITILPRGHAWAIDGGDADSKVSTVGAISHHGQKTEDNYRQYFKDEFISSKGEKCESMIRDGFFIDAESYGEALWKKLKDRTDGALLDWTRQHVPPWDFVYLNCMKTLSCRPLDDAEPLPVVVPRPLQSKLPFLRVPKDAKFEACAGEWETCQCVGYVYFGTATRQSRVVKVSSSEGQIECKADNFEGDPAVGDVKKCHCAKG